MSVLSDNRSGEEIDVAWLEELAAYVLAAERAPEAAELSLSIVGDEEMRALNRDYRGIDATTDVLAFECDEPVGEGGLPGDWPQAGEGEDAEPRILGDVIVSPEQARRHAEDFQSSFEREICLLVVHGTLHLLGYDHIADDEAEAMERRETQLVAELMAQKR